MNILFLEPKFFKKWPMKIPTITDWENISNDEGYKVSIQKLIPMNRMSGDQPIWKEFFGLDEAPMDCLGKPITLDRIWADTRKRQFFVQLSGFKDKKTSLSIISKVKFYEAITIIDWLYTSEASKLRRNSVSKLRKKIEDEREAVDFIEE